MLRSRNPGAIFAASSQALSRAPRGRGALHCAADRSFMRRCILVQSHEAGKELRLVNLAVAQRDEHRSLVQKAVWRA